MVAPREIFFSRLLFAFVNIGVGASYVFQHPPVSPSRRFLENLPVPFWVYGALIIIFGFLIAFASVMDRAFMLTVVLQVAAVFWFVFSLGFLPPVFGDPVHASIGAFCVLFFVGGVHQAAALIEAGRA